MNELKKLLTLLILFLMLPFAIGIGLEDEVQYVNIFTYYFDPAQFIVVGHSVSINTSYFNFTINLNTTVNVTYNITNNITNNVTTVYNITNNITNIIQYNITNQNYTMNCTTVGGVCSVISSINITYLITEIKVIPFSFSNSYQSNVTEYPTVTNVIDRDIIAHTGTWAIEKNYGINGQAQANIINASIDELFRIQINYLSNGVQ